MHDPLSRRTVLKSALAASLAAMGAARAPGSTRKFRMDLTCGSIGVGAGQREAIALAGRHGFESVAPDVGFLAGLSDSECADLVDQLEDLELAWGTAGLPVDFRGADDSYRKGLEALPAQAKALQRAGVTRMSTWITPASKDLPFDRNLEFHAARLRPVAEILGDHGVRFGLEYVGPRTSRAGSPHPFVHDLKTMRQLLAAIGKDNMGVVLDSWHWYCSHETVDDLKTLTNDDVVACDLNDAPAGIPVDEQKDLVRALPCATGVIDLRAFLNALVAIGYDGPVRAEPFDASLRKLPAEEAVAKTAAAMKQAFALLG